MKLCVNYLSEVKELLEEGKIDFIDYIKLYSINGDLTPFDWCVSKKDVMFHGMLGKFANICDENYIEGRDIKLQKDYYQRGNTPYISAHINIDWNLDLKNISPEKTLKDTKENIEILRKNFDMKIILENVPAHPEKKSKYFLSEPEFIKQVVEENDTGFLFDIGHARVAAETLGIPFDEYVNRLPMDRLVETHLAGCMKKLDGTLTANHSKMHEEDFEFIVDAVKRYKTLEVVTLEYGSFVEHDLVGTCPMVSYDKVDPIAKKEVYEQLMRLKNIITIV